MHLFNPFGCNSDPLQLMYGCTVYFKYFELAMYGYIHFVRGTIYPWLYASTSTVLIWIDITNVPPTDFMNLAAICLLYSLCTDVLPISNGLYKCILAYLEIWLYACTETVLIGIEVINVPCRFSILLVEIWCCTNDDGRTSHFKYFELAMYGPFILWGSI